MDNGSQTIAKILLASLILFSGSVAKSVQALKRKSCYVSKIDNKDSTKLASEYFYYPSGIDSLSINYEDGLSRKFYSFYDESGRIIRHETRFPDGDLGAIVTFQWVSADSLIFRRQVVGNSVDFKVSIKLINPKNFPDRGIAGDSIKYSHATSNDTSVDYSAIVVMEFDSLGSVSKVVSRQWDRGRYSVDTTTYINYYERNLLTKYTEIDEGGVKYYFCEYQETATSIFSRNQVGKKYASHQIFRNYNLKGQRVTPSLHFSRK